MMFMQHKHGCIPLASFDMQASCKPFSSAMIIRNLVFTMRWAPLEGIRTPNDARFIAGLSLAHCPASPAFASHNTCNNAAMTCDMPPSMRSS